MPGPVWSKGINGEYIQLSAGQIKIDCEQRKSALSSEWGKEESVICGRRQLYASKMQSDSAMYTNCILLWSLIMHEHKSHIRNSDIYLDIYIYILFNRSCNCKKKIRKIIFLRCFILPNLHKADRPPRNMFLAFWANLCRSWFCEIFTSYMTLSKWNFTPRRYKTAFH